MSDLRLIPRIPLWLIGAALVLPAGQAPARAAETSRAPAARPSFVTVTASVTDAKTKETLPGALVRAWFQSTKAVWAVRVPAGGTVEFRLPIGQADLLWIAASSPGYQAGSLTRRVEPTTGDLKVALALTTVIPHPAPSPSPSPSPEPVHLTINRGATFTRTPEVTLETVLTFATSPGLTMSFSNDGRAWSPPEPFSPTTRWPLAAGDGTKTVRVKLVGKGGGRIGTAQHAIVLDSTAPTLTITTPRTGDLIGGSAGGLSP